QHPVLLRAAEVDEIAGRDHRVRALLQLQQLGHTALEHRRGVDDAVGEAPVRLDVRIGDLGKQHRIQEDGAAIAGRVNVSDRRAPGAKSQRYGMRATSGRRAPASISSRVWSPWYRLASS